jgi:hypothetical protein
MPTAGPAAIPEENTLGDIQSLINMFGSVFGMTGNSSSSSTSPEGLDAAQQFLPALLNMIMGQDYSPQAAERDSAPAVQLILQQALESGMPGISASENSAGAYNSTTAALLRNDLAARAAGEGAALTTKNKATYGALRTGQANSVISLINSIIGASRRSSTTTTTPNLASNPAARRAAALAAGAAAARSALKPKAPGGISARPQNPGLQGVDDFDRTPMFNVMDPNPGDISIDDMDTFKPGPTPSVSVENVGNTDTGTDGGFGDLGDPNGDNFAGLDLMNLGDLGSDLNAFDGAQADVGSDIIDIPDDPNAGADFEFLGGGNDFIGPPDDLGGKEYD